MEEDGFQVPQNEIFTRASRSFVLHKNVHTRVLCSTSADCRLVCSFLSNALKTFCFLSREKRIHGRPFPCRVLASFLCQKSILLSTKQHHHHYQRQGYSVSQRPTHREKSKQKKIFHLASFLSTVLPFLLLPLEKVFACFGKASCRFTYSLLLFPLFPPQPVSLARATPSSFAKIMIDDRIS
jgi:hypothetical protein